MRQTIQSLKERAFSTSSTRRNSSLNQTSSVVTTKASITPAGKPFWQKQPRDRPDLSLPPTTTDGNGDYHHLTHTKPITPSYKSSQFSSTKSSNAGNNGLFDSSSNSSSHSSGSATNKKTAAKQGKFIKKKGVDDPIESETIMSYQQRPPTLNDLVIAIDNNNHNTQWHQQQYSHQIQFQPNHPLHSDSDKDRGSSPNNSSNISNNSNNNKNGANVNINYGHNQANKHIYQNTSNSEKDSTHLREEKTKYHLRDAIHRQEIKRLEGENSGLRDSNKKLQEQLDHYRHLRNMEVAYMKQKEAEMTEAKEKYHSSLLKILQFSALSQSPVNRTHVELSNMLSQQSQVIVELTHRVSEVEVEKSELETMLKNLLFKLKTTKIQPSQIHSLDQQTQAATTNANTLLDVLSTEAASNKPSFYYAHTLSTTGDQSSSFLNYPKMATTDQPPLFNRTTADPQTNQQTTKHLQSISDHSPNEEHPIASNHVSLDVPQCDMQTPQRMASPEVIESLRCYPLSASVPQTEYRPIAIAGGNAAVAPLQVSNPIAGTNATTAPTEIVAEAGTIGVHGMSESSMMKSPSAEGFIFGPPLNPSVFSNEDECADRPNSRVLFISQHQHQGFSESPNISSATPKESSNNRHPTEFTWNPLTQELIINEAQLASLIDGYKRKHLSNGGGVQS